MRFLSSVATIIGLIGWAGLAVAQPVTVRMWMHEHPPRVPIDKTIIAEFEKANPDIKVQYDVISAPEYSTKLLTAFAAGSGPDLFNNTSTLVTQYYAARILAPIDYAATGYGDEALLAGEVPGRLRRHPLPGQALRHSHRGLQLGLLRQQYNVEGGRARPDEGLAEDVGSPPRRRRETHQTRSERRADPPRVRFRLDHPGHVLVHAQHHDPPARRQHGGRGHLQGRPRHRRRPAAPFNIFRTGPTSTASADRNTPPAAPTSSPANSPPSAASASGASRKCRMRRSIGA